MPRSRYKPVYHIMFERETFLTFIRFIRTILRFVFIDEVVSFCFVHGICLFISTHVHRGGRMRVVKKYDAITRLNAKKRIGRTYEC